MPASRTHQYQIEVVNRQSAVKVSTAWLRRIAAGTLRAEEVAAAEISIAVVSDAEIHQVNRDFLAHDYPTDVISFLLESSGPEQSRVPRGRGKTLAGEIVLSAETAAEEAQRFGWTALNECGLYVVHGLLHLCGYDDLTPREKRIMRARERAVLAPWELTPRYAAVSRSKSAGT